VFNCGSCCCIVLILLCLRTFLGLYDANLQQLANSRTVQVISSCLVLALSEYEVSRSRANALAKLNTRVSGVPPARRENDERARQKPQQDQMSVLTGTDTEMGRLDEGDEDAAIDSDDEGGAPSTASIISLTRLRFTVTSVIALREAARFKQNMYSSYLSRSILAFTGPAVVGEGLDGCSRYVQQARSHTGPIPTYPHFRSPSFLGRLWNF